MTLAEVLSRGVPIEWYEGVALVRAILARLLDESQRPDLFPELNEIELLPNGDVSFATRNSVKDRVERAHRILRQVLVDASPPVQLRLLLSQPSLGSLREYDESLAYFERPGRAEVLAELHARATQDVPAVVLDAPVLARIAPRTADKIVLPPVEPEVPSSRRAVPPRPLNRWLKVLGAAAAVLAVAASALYLTSDSTDQPEALSIAAEAPVSGKPVKSGVPAAGGRAGRGPAIGNQPAARSGRPPAQTVAVPTAVRKSSSEVKKSVAQTPVVPGQVSKASIAAPPTRELLGTSTVVPMKSAAPPSAPSSPIGDSLVIEAFADNEPPTYSAGSPGVTPPVSLMPPLPSSLPANIDPQEIGRIELVVGPDGSVESVRLLAVFGSVRHTLLLSAVKAWKFEPAMKDGQPVRYRQSVWLGPGGVGEPFSWQLVP